MIKEWLVLIVDDVMAIREGISIAIGGVPGVRVTKICATAQETVAAVEHTHFDLALVDLNLDDENGIELGRALRTLDPELKIIIYSKEASIVIAGDVFRHNYTGASISDSTLMSSTGQPLHTNGTTPPAPNASELHGYLLLKNITPLNFANELEKLGHMGSVVDSEILDMLIERLNRHTLTPDEMRCGALIGAGKSNAEIAEALGSSLPEVENLIGNVYSKLAIEGDAKDPERHPLLTHAMLHWHSVHKAR